VEQWECLKNKIIKRASSKRDANPDADMRPESFTRTGEAITYNRQKTINIYI